jgi:hypothetical protein
MKKKNNRNGMPTPFSLANQSLLTKNRSSYTLRGVSQSGIAAEISIQVNNEWV